MKMQDKGRNKITRPANRGNFIDDDFADILYEGRFDKFKPLLKVLVVVLILAGVGYGAYAYLSKLPGGGARSADTQQVDNQKLSPLDRCVGEAWDSHEIPDESDPDFYPKLIAGYDAQLACYDAHSDDERSAGNRLSIESARKSAIDSSDRYKDIYLTNNSYDYKPSGASSAGQYSSGSGASGGGSSSVGSSGGSSSSTPPSTNSGGSASAPSEWELNQAEFDAARSCANNAAASVLIQGAYGSPSYYQQKIAQLEAQLACTSSAKYSMAQQQHSSYQSQIAMNKVRYNDSINPDSPSYYPNSY